MSGATDTAPTLRDLARRVGLAAAFVGIGLASLSLIGLFAVARVAGRVLR
jgi:hypothetical protein